MNPPRRQELELTDQRGSNVRRAVWQSEEESRGPSPVEKWRDLACKVLQIINSGQNEREAIRAITVLIRDHAGLEAGGIRPRDGSDFPYYETAGSSEHSVDTELCLCSKDIGGGEVRNSSCDVALEDLEDSTAVAIRQFRLERELRESRARFCAMFSCMNNAAAVYRAVDEGDDFVFEDLNEAGERLDKIRRADAIGRSVREVLPAVETSGLLNVFRRVWASGESEHFPVSVYEDDRICEWRENFVYRLPSGEIMAICEDATERKQAECDLHESEERFRLLAEAAFEAIFVIYQGEIIEANNRAAERFGYAPDELVGMNIADFAAPESRALAIENIAEGLEEPYEIMAMRKDGTFFPVEVRDKAIRCKGSVLMIKAMRDTSDRKKAEQELKIANEILEAKHIALREKNLALKNILEQVSSEKEELKAQIQSNVERVVLPTLRQLRQRVDLSTATYVDLLDSNLRDIASPLVNRLELNYASLSPGEIEICNMIQKGLSSQEMANLRNVSVQTISMQRKRIRKKLDITNQSVSLSSLLKSLTY